MLFIISEKCSSFPKLFLTTFLLFRNKNDLETTKSTKHIAVAIPQKDVSYLVASITSNGIFRTDHSIRVSDCSIRVSRSILFLC